MELFDLSKFAFAKLINEAEPWESLSLIEKFIEKQKENLLKDGYVLKDQALIHISLEGAVSSQVISPCIFA